jgi:hypothetical protein
MSTKDSKVWKYFEDIKDVQNVRCKLNNNHVVKRSDSSTKGMWSHLKNHHKDAWKELKKDDPEKKEKLSVITYIMCI